MESRRRKTEVDLELYQRKFVEALRKLDLSGDNYYATRKEALTQAEKLTAKYIEETLPVDTPLCEVGCGLGQLAFLLAIIGYQVTAVDGDPARFGKLVKMLSLLREEFSMPNFVAASGIYPDDHDPPDAALVFGNVVNTAWDNYVEEVGPLKALGGHRAIVDLRVWGRVRSPEEILNLQEELRTGADVELVGLTVFDVAPC
jgi:SAM-dependent methyltransferase